MSGQDTVNTLDTYVNEYQKDNREGISLRVENAQGGGSNISDESVTYETRRAWLEENGGEHKDLVWTTLASGKYKGSTMSDEEELVYIRIPGWYINLDDNETLQRTLPQIPDGSWYEDYAVIDAESSADSGGWGVKRFYANACWENPISEYGYAWTAKSCSTVFRAEGTARPVDTERIYTRDALPDDVDGYKASEEDYDWRLALSKAFQRSEDSVRSPLEQAKNRVKEQPEQLQPKILHGFEQYVNRAEGDGRDPSERELADVLDSIVDAFDPSVQFEF